MRLFVSRTMGLISIFLIGLAVSAVFQQDFIRPVLANSLGSKAGRRGEQSLSAGQLISGCYSYPPNPYPYPYPGAGQGVSEPKVCRVFLPLVSLPVMHTPGGAVTPTSTPTPTPSPTPSPTPTPTYTPTPLPYPWPGH